MSKSQVLRNLSAEVENEDIKDKPRVQQKSQNK